MEEEPYVIYRIDAGIPGKGGKGVAFNIRQALSSFMTERGFQFRTTDFDASSDRLGLYLEIYPNEHDDFNVQKLLNHLNNSGKLPHNKCEKPEIKIIPIPRDKFPAPEKQEYPASYEGTVEILQAQIRNLEQKTADLTKDLDNERKITSTQSGKINGLEEKIKNGVPIAYNDPISAILDCHVANFSDLFLEVAAEWESLDDEGRKIMIELQREQHFGEISHIDYINRIQMFGNRKTFSDEKEFQQWLDSMGSLTDFRQLPEYQKTSDEINQINKDIELIASLGKGGASQGLLESLKKIVEENNSKASELAERLRNIESSFESDAISYKLLKDSRGKYKKLSKVFASSLKRKESKYELPFVANQSEEGFEIYFPSIDGHNPLEQNIIDSLHSLSGGNYSIEFAERKNFTFISMKAKGESDKESIQPLEISRILSDNEVLKLLGIKPIVFNLFRYS